MKRFILSIFCLATSAFAQTSPDANTQLIALRDTLTAAHVAQLATVSADFKIKLEAANADRDAAIAALSTLQNEITTVLTSTLADLTPQLTAAQADLDAELKTGDGPQAAAKRLTVTALQARIDTLNALIAEASKPDKQKALEAAQAAKAAADKAVLDAQAALNQP